MFLKFEIREGYIETYEEEIAESRFGYIEGHREFEKLSKCLFVSNVRITWVLDSISERILFFSETKVLPQKIYFVNKQKFFDINNYQMVEEIIELKGSINNKEKNALNDLRNQYSSLEKSLNYANFFSALFPYYHHIYLRFPECFLNQVHDFWHPFWWFWESPL